MKTNLGIADRALRLALAALVVVLYLAGVLSPVAAIVLGILAAVFILTSVVGLCPLYLLLGLSTKGKRPAK